MNRYRFNEGIKRINNINWGLSGSVDVPSNMALIQEYIRRAALFIKTYDLKTPYPFFKAANALGFEDDLGILVLCPHLKDLKNAFMRVTCEAYLEWLYLVDNGNEPAIKFHDLYEPLILLIERGGTIRRHHGDIIAGGYAFPLANADYMSKQAPIDISDEGLKTWGNNN
ncbi:hypothetical protein ABEW60_00550 [Paenibacillus jamilae]|uniref:hypothetical protein n=1 Tax=Paenibacillus jamilae TaxID=114136 RepID=UPI003D2E5B36